MLRRLWLVCVLTMAPALAAAQPGPPAAALVAATDQAQAGVAAAAQRASQVVALRARLVQRYQDQLAAVDRLKNERASWRRDRELRASLADAADTANQLGPLSPQLAAANDALAKARRALAAAIDAELAAGVTGARGGQLVRLRAALDTALGARAKKIVLPAFDEKDLDTADPEELEQQAQVIADAEKQLASQIAGLDQQATELARTAELRRSHDRANDMMIRDDDQPHRDVQHSTGASHLDGAAATPSSSATGGGGTSGATGGDAFDGKGTSFETEATFVLGEVIDPSTIDTLARASRSGDPAKRAAAARAARDAVAARLELLRKQRAQIEQRERQLRGH